MRSRLITAIRSLLRPNSDRLDALDGRFARVEGELQEIRASLKKLFSATRQIEPGLAAIVRRLALDPQSVPYPERLTAHRFRIDSQNDEDGITLGLFDQIGVTNRKFVELGSGLSGGNSAFLANELGWTGLMVDGDADRMRQVARRFPRVTAVGAWITAEGVNGLIRQHGLAGEIDLLSIDLDGNDYWVWKAIDACSPRVVIVEYNSIFGADRAVTIPYDPKFDLRTHRFVYYGASLAALARLAEQKGYRLVTTTPSGINAYFLRDDVGPEIPGCSPQRAYRMQRKYDVLIREKGLDIFKYVEEQGLGLVEVE